MNCSYFCVGLNLLYCCRHTGINCLALVNNNIRLYYSCEDFWFEMIGKEGLESTQVLIQHAMSRSMVDTFEIVDAHFHLWKPETHHWLREIIDKETAAGNTG